MTSVVVMPTFNGQRHVGLQLESIAGQTVPPDEVIVGDDHSTDATLEVVGRFAQRSSLRIRVISNESTLGLAANLRRLVQACEADIIFLSDQDDVWDPRKIEMTLGVFAASASVDAVAADSLPFDSRTGRHDELTWWSSMLRGREPKPDLALLAYRNFVSGHNLAVRRSALGGALWPEGDISVDYWLALVFAARGALALLPTPLVSYRQHDSNSVGARGRLGRERNLAQLARTSATLEAVRKLLSEDGRLAGDADAVLTKRLRFLSRRVRYLRHPLAHPLTPLSLLSRGDYRDFANGWRSFAGDLRTLGRPSREAPRARGTDELRKGLRLGLYADLTYQADEDGISSSTPFVGWLGAIADHVTELVVFGRLIGEAGRLAYPLDARENTRFVALPYYESLHDVRAVAAATRGALRAVRGQLKELDAVLVFGPHPLGDLIGLQARVAGKPVIVGVREDLSQYLSHRLDGRTGRIARAAAVAMEALHKAVSIGTGAVVVGEDMAGRYRSSRRRVLVTGVSLLATHDSLFAEPTIERPWPGDRLIAVVGRLDPEKNPLMLLDVAERLQGIGQWRMEVAGTGRLGVELATEIERRRLGGVLRLCGRLDRVRLIELYRRASVLLHVSHTEGVPQVLYEAAAARIPIIATAVGGVPHALAFGAYGRLVPSDQVEAIIEALEALSRDAERREHMVDAAYRWARADTRDSQVARVVLFVEEIAGMRRPASLGPTTLPKPAAGPRQRTAKPARQD